MVIVGAGGYAKEILDLLKDNNYAHEIFFFDNVNKNKKKVFSTYHCFNSIDEMKEHFKKSKHFIIGFGYSDKRESMFSKLIEIGGIPVSVISQTAKISDNIHTIGKGNVIMHNCTIGPEVKIGDNCAFYHNTVITHDCEIGNNCEIAPNVSLLGRVKLGYNVKIGANSTILPDIEVGNNVTIGAGSVVTKNITNNTTVTGVPAKKHKGNG